MNPNFIAIQAVMLIKSFPKIAKSLGDLTNPATLESLRTVSSLLMQLNIIHVARVEAKEQLTSFKHNELKNLEENVMSLVARLIEFAGASRIVTIDIHSEQEAGFSEIPWDTLYASYSLLPILQLRLARGNVCYSLRGKEECLKNFAR